MLHLKRVQLQKKTGATEMTCLWSVVCVEFENQPGVRVNLLGVTFFVSPESKDWSIGEFVIS